PVAVRLPAGRLTDRPFGAGGVEALLAQRGGGGGVLELPEAAPVLASPELRRRLSDLGRLGVGVALDGFGGTATPPAALLRLPVDLVRLDRELTDGLLESPALRTVTGALLRLTGDLGVPTLADGIDHPDLAATLRALGCTHAQGPLFSEPLEPARLHRLLEGGRLPVPGATGAPAAGPAAELA
ncbi:EAL domain-containing protein, partial [Streptomyces harbinensis]|uniref:EAL domain-containing protein n=1 Tax=Streptomyces harbinensis TaxID=1176198 RepID=UPI0034DDF388